MFIKFSKKEYLENFRKGNIYMNSQQFFQNLEKNDSVRGDKFEGTDQIHQPKDIANFIITDNSTGKQICLNPNDIIGPVRIGFGKKSYNLFSLYELNPNNLFVDVDRGLIIDDRMRSFGDSFIVVTNANEFLRRAEISINAMSLNFMCDKVTYCDIDSYSGDTGPFWKPDRFSYQQEFRILASPGSTGAIVPHIGDLVDITTPIYPVSDISQIVKIS